MNGSRTEKRTPIRGGDTVSFILILLNIHTIHYLYKELHLISPSPSLTATAFLVFLAFVAACMLSAFSYNSRAHTAPVQFPSGASPRTRPRLLDRSSPVFVLWSLLICQLVLWRFALRL